MSPSQSFTNELARLVWLLVYRPAHVDDQKRALRVMLGAAKVESQRVAQTEVAGAVVEAANLKPLPQEVPWLSELATRMSMHSVRAIEVEPGAKAPELLGFARALSTQGSRDDHGEAFDRQVVALGLTTISVQLGRDGFVRTATPPFGMKAVGVRPALTPASGMTSVADAVAEQGTSASSVALSARYTGSGELPEGVRDTLQQDLMPPGMANDLVIRLRGALTPEGAPVVLDEVSRLMEDASRDGDWGTVLDMAINVMEREAAVTDTEVKRAFAIQMRRLSKPGILRGIAQLLPRRRDLRDKALAFIHRQGNPAADVLVELLVAAESSSDRRAYRDALRQCPSAVEPLVQLLRDHRWFVVRNAAELLGEMNAVEADQELINTLRHRDARVRHAATMSLIRLGTPRAVHTIIRSLSDADPSVRLKAALGLGRVSNPRALPALLEALDAEEDEAVQHAILSALGHHAHEDAVSRLAREAKPGPLLKRRPLARRLAAVHGLGDAGTDEARRALRDLLKDRDRSVRELADRLLKDHAQEVPTHH